MHKKSEKKEKPHPMLHGQHEGHAKKGLKEPEGKMMNADHHHKAMMHHMKALHKMAKKHHKPEGK